MELRNGRGQLAVGKEVWRQWGRGRRAWLAGRMGVLSFLVLGRSQLYFHHFL